MSTDLIERAGAGDERAFRELIEPYRRELHVHCYRLLGSVQDAEDALQETLLAAWRGLADFEGRSSIRTWLYRVATSRCLNARRAGSRRVQPATPPADVRPPEPTRHTEVTWLEPYPDLLLAELADTEPGPETQYETIESISLAFLTAVQTLPPRQGAVLILRDVLGFPAREVAETLDTTEESVTSALKRARVGLRDRLPDSTEPPAVPGSSVERALVDRLTRAYQAGAVHDVVALLTDDVWLAMPPMPLEYRGRALVSEFLATVAFRDGRTYRLVPTRANSQLALATYLTDQPAGTARANDLLVLTLTGGRIARMTRFAPHVLPWFALPAALPL